MCSGILQIANNVGGTISQLHFREPRGKILVVDGSHNYFQDSHLCFSLRRCAAFSVAYLSVMLSL